MAALPFLFGEIFLLNAAGASLIRKAEPDSVTEGAPVQHARFRAGHLSAKS